MNVNHPKVATGSSQANGQVERVNRVLAPALAKIDGSDKSWYKILSDIEFAINNTVHKSTGETPSRLLFGVIQRGANINKLKEYLEDM